METFRFIVQDENLKEKITAKLLAKKYQVNVDPEKAHMKEKLDCFVFWSDGSRKCILTKNSGGDNQKIINDKNIDWFLKQL